MRRDWTNVGKCHSQGNEEKLSGMFERLNWLTPPCDMPMAPGEGIKGAIKELTIPRVSRVAYSHELAPYGLLGIEGNYKNGRVQIYLVDEGDSVVPLAMDHHAEEVVKS